MIDSNHIIPPLPEACQKVEDLLMDYAYGELDAAARREFDAHLAGCARCQGSVEAVMGTRKVMQVLSPEPAPSAGLESLLAYAEKEAERARSAASAKAPWWKSARMWAGLVPVAGMAAAMLVVVTRQAESGTIVSQLAPPPAETPAVVEVAAAADGKLKAEAQARPVVVADEKKAEAREEKEGVAAPAEPALEKDQFRPADSLASTGRSAPALAQTAPPKVTAKTLAADKNVDGLLRGADFGGGGGIDGERRQEQAKAKKKSARFDAPEPSKAIADLEADTRREPAAPGAAERQRVAPSDFGTNAVTHIGLGAGGDSFGKGSAGGAAVGSAAPEREAPQKARRLEEDALADRDDAPAPPPPSVHAAMAEKSEKRAAAKEMPRGEAKAPAPEQPYVTEVASAAPAPAPSPAPAAPSAVMDRAGPAKPSAARPAAKADVEVDPFGEGVRAANSGRFAEAVPLLQRALAEHPSDVRAPGALFALAQAQGAQGDLAGALRSWEVFLSRFPGDGRAPEAAVRRAELLASLHRDSEYDAALSELQKRYPASPAVRRLLERESKANRAAEPASISR